jgi:hypothetical protein
MTQDLETIFNNNCSIIYLVDENLCAKTSYPVFNYNFNILKDSSLYLDSFTPSWYQLYTIFSANSSKWLEAFENIKNLNQNWTESYTTVNAFSSFWIKPIEIVYPHLVNFDQWYSNINTFKNITIKNWLDVNFSPLNYAQNSELFISINLVKEEGFQFQFERSFFENCQVNLQTSIACPRCPIPGVKCNWSTDKNKKNVPGCNFCNLCRITAGAGGATLSCGQSQGATTLKIFYQKTLSDRFINRIEKIKYVNTNNQWSIV